MKNNIIYLLYIIILFTLLFTDTNEKLTNIDKNQINPKHNKKKMCSCKKEWWYTIKGEPIKFKGCDNRKPDSNKKGHWCYINDTDNSYKCEGAIKGETYGGVTSYYKYCKVEDKLLKEEETKPVSKKICATKIILLETLWDSAQDMILKSDDSMYTKEERSFLNRNKNKNILSLIELFKKKFNCK